MQNVGTRDKMDQVRVNAAAGLMLEKSIDIEY